jgi:hypothetical protein
MLSEYGRRMCRPGQKTEAKSATLLLHYLFVMTLELKGKHEAVESLMTVFHSWLPVISGLVGGATTYYFTRDK